MQIYCIISTAVDEKTENRTSLTIPWDLILYEQLHKMCNGSFACNNMAPSQM